MKMFGWKCKECGYGDFSVKKQEYRSPEKHMEKSGHGKRNYQIYGIKHPDKITSKMAKKLHDKV